MGISIIQKDPISHKHFRDIENKALSSFISSKDLRSGLGHRKEEFQLQSLYKGYLETMVRDKELKAVPEKREVKLIIKGSEVFSQENGNNVVSLNASMNGESPRGKRKKKMGKVGSGEGREIVGNKGNSEENMGNKGNGEEMVVNRLNYASEMMMMRKGGYGSEICEEDYENEISKGNSMSVIVLNKVNEEAGVKKSGGEGVLGKGNSEVFSKSMYGQFARKSGSGMYSYSEIKEQASEEGGGRKGDAGGFGPWESVKTPAALGGKR